MIGVVVICLFSILLDWTNALHNLLHRLRSLILATKIRAITAGILSKASLVKTWVLKVLPSSPKNSISTLPFASGSISKPVRCVRSFGSPLQRSAPSNSALLPAERCRFLSWVIPKRRWGNVPFRPSVFWVFLRDVAMLLFSHCHFSLNTRHFC